MKPSEIQLPSNRKFGVFFSFVFLAAAGYFFWMNAVVIGSLAALIGCLFAFITIIKDELLLPFNKLWMRFGLLLAAIVSPIILGAIFFLLFTPIALGMRLFGRDELRLKKLQSQTFWKPRDPIGPDSESFKYQF